MGKMIGRYMYIGVTFVFWDYIYRKR